jgi:hypothetical protein
MEKRFQFDREVLIPLGVAALSTLGIIVVILMISISKPETDIPMEDTPTPFEYLFLGTVTATTTPEPSLAEQLETPATDEAGAALDLQITPTPNIQTSQGGTDSATSESTPDTTVTPTTNPTIFTAGKFDDIDERIIYDGGWVSEIVDIAFGETLFISTLTGDIASFTFTGTHFIIGYLEDPGLGTMTVSIDGENQIIDQSAGFEWLSPELPAGEHSVTIIHETGEIIVLDYIVIQASP